MNRSRVLVYFLLATLVVGVGTSLVTNQKIHPTELGVTGRALRSRVAIQPHAQLCDAGKADWFLVLSGTAGTCPNRR